MDSLMAEPMRLPGCPQIVVTRGWAYEWLKKLGYSERGGFASIDYLVFGLPGREADTLTSADLTDLTQPHVKALLKRMENDSTEGL